jgi:hypothetical protein
MLLLQLLLVVLPSVCSSHHVCGLLQDFQGRGLLLLPGRCEGFGEL